MTTYPLPNDPVHAMQRSGGQPTEAHSTDHGRVIGIWENVKHWGATGDGTTDDTLAIQAAIDELGFTGGTVYFPVGVYCHTGLTMTTGIRLVGSGIFMDESINHGTRLHYTASTGTGLDITPLPDGLSGPHIENLGFTGTSKANDTIGIHLHGDSLTPMARGMLHNVRAAYFGTGIKATFALETTFLDTYVFENDLGLHLFDTSNACSIIGGGYRQNNTGIHIEQTGSTFIAPGVVVESNNEIGLLVTGSDVSTLVIGGHYENNPTGIKFAPSAPDTIADSLLRGCYIAASSIAALDVDRTSNLHGEIMLTSAETILLGANAQFCNIHTTRQPDTYTDSGNYNVLMYTDSGVDGYTRIVSSAGLHLGNIIQMSEVSAPAAPAVNGVRFYARDSGGKTQLVARFNTGAVQVIAAEP